MAEKLTIRKIYSVVDEVISENGVELEKSIYRAAALAVIKNPYAGKYQEDLSVLIDFGEELGKILAKKLRELLSDFSEKDIHSYGKAAIVGKAGEIEHGHAILHPKIGAPFREALGGKETARAVIPSNTKLGTVGTTIDIPVHYRDSEWVVSHVDTITVTVPDAPLDDEIIIGLAVTVGGRPNPRVPGMTIDDVE